MPVLFLLQIFFYVFSFYVTENITVHVVVMHSPLMMYLCFKGIVHAELLLMCTVSSTVDKCEHLLNYYNIC